MKTFQNSLILILVTLATMFAYTVTKPKPKPVLAAVVETVEVAEEKPAPIVVKEEPKVEVKEEPRVNLDKLPDGTFYVRERVVVKNEKGIFSFSVGEKVNEIGKEHGNLLVSNGTITLEVEPWKLTDSKSYGEMLNRKLQDQKVIRIPEVSVAVEVVEPPKPDQKSVPLAVPTVDKNAMRVAAIDAQIKVLQDKIDYLQTKNSSKVNANGPTITRLEIEIKKLEAQK